MEENTHRAHDSFRREAPGNLLGVIGLYFTCRLFRQVSREPYFKVAVFSLELQEITNQSDLCVINCRGHGSRLRIKLLHTCKYTPTYRTPLVTEDHSLQFNFSRPSTAMVRVTPTINICTYGTQNAWSDGKQ